MNKAAQALAKAIKALDEQAVDSPEFAEQFNFHINSMMDTAKMNGLLDEVAAELKN